MPRRFTRLHQLATTLLLAAACSGAPEPEQPSDGTQPLCATCAPRAGGETSDFGTACFAECGEIEPARPLTEEELRRFEVDRALALLRDGVMTPIGWLPPEAGRSGLRRTRGLSSSGLGVVQPMDVCKHG